MLEMRRRDQRTFADGVNDAARTEERIEIDMTDRRRAAAVVKRRIGMRAKVRRQGDRADIHRAPGADLRVPSLLVTGVSGKRR